MTMTMTLYGNLWWQLGIPWKPCLSARGSIVLQECQPLRVDPDAMVWEWVLWCFIQAPKTLFKTGRLRKFKKPMWRIPVHNFLNWVCLKIVYPYTQWFSWSLFLWKLAISLGIYPIFKHTQLVKPPKNEHWKGGHLDFVWAQNDKLDVHCIWKIQRSLTSTPINMYKIYLYP